MTERLDFHFSLSCIGEGNGNPLQCSCLENPRDCGAWLAAVYGVAQSRTQLHQLSSSGWWCKFLLRWAGLSWNVIDLPASRVLKGWFLTILSNTIIGFVAEDLQSSSHTIPEGLTPLEWSFIKISCPPPVAATTRLWQIGFHVYLYNFQRLRKMYLLACSNCIWG